MTVSTLTREGTGHGNQLESQRLRDLITTGAVMPENGRWDDRPDPRSQWEHLVREIYRLERDGECSNS